MKTPSILAAVVVAVAAAGGTAVAEPSYSSRLDSYTLERATSELEQLARSEGISNEAAQLLLKLDVFATSSDTGCPGVDVDVVNATNRTVWNVEVEITQKDGSNERTETVHLPYMTKDSKTRVLVSCLQDYTYRSRYESQGAAPIQLSYQAKGAKSLDEALPLLLAQKKDFVASRTEVSPAPVPGRSLLEEALAMDDADVAKELVLAIARTGIGREELGKALELYGTGALADEVAASMQKLPAAQQAQLARTLLASPAALRWKAKLDPMIDRQLCTGNRGDVIGLWLQAQSRTGVPVEEFRTKIAAKCKPTVNDGVGFVAALDKAPDSAGALDAVDPALFANVLAQWKAVKAPSTGFASHMAFLRYSANAERFTAAAAVLQPGGVPVALSGVVLAEDNAATAAKAAWIAQAVPGIDPAVRAAAIEDATSRLVEGAINAAPIRQAVKGLRAIEPAAVEQVLSAAAAKTAKVFDPAKLQGVDLADHLAFEATLGDCTSTINSLDACARKIAADPVFAKLTKTALKPEFTVAMANLVRDLRDENGLFAIAGELRSAGFDVGFVAEGPCRDARNAVEYNGDPERHLEIAKRIDAGAPCIADAADAMTAKDRRALKFAIFAILGLVVPLPVGGYLAKRRWKKVQAALPPDTTGDATDGEKLDDRLGAQGLGRALRDGVADAKRELLNAGGLASIDDTVIFAAQGTVKRAVKTGDAATVIIKRAAQGDAVYIVALPVKQPRPQVVQRYLGAPWPEHVAQIQRAAGMPVLALLVFCGPDAGEATLLVGTCDGTTTSDPDAVLDAKEARERGANRFRFTATISSTTSKTSEKAA